MPEKRKQAVRRKLSGLLAVTMLFGAVFNHFWGRMFYATSPDVATGSDAVRNGIVSLTNLPAEDVQVIVMSDEGGYEQGGSYCVDVYIKNDTAETIEDASLNYSAASIEKESVYFEDLSVDVGTEDPITIITDTDRTEGTDEIPAPTAGQTDGSGEPTDPTAGQTGVTEGPTDPTAEPTGGSGELTVPTAGPTGVTEEPTDPTVEPTGMTEAPTDPTAEPIEEGEGTKPTLPAGEKAGSSAGDIVTEGADEDEDMDQGDDSDDEEEEEPWRLTELTIQPGQSYHVQFYFQVKESIKGTKSQTIEFIFRWKDGEGKHRSTKGTFHYVVGAMNLLPVEVLNPYLLETDQAKKLYAGGKGEMLIDFELGGVWEIIEEEEIKAGDVDIPEADEPVSTKSDAEKADPSDQGTASVSDAKIATPPQASTDEKLDDYTNGTIQWGEETSGKPIVEKVKCDVDTYGIRLTDFRLAPREEEDEYGTTARCTFRVSKDVKPGTYYGTVTANYTFKNKRFTSSQGFAIQVAMIDDEAVAAVVALIDDLPEMEEIAEAQEAYLMSDDEDGWDAYYTELTEKVVHAYQEYIALTEEQQELVYNRDKLLAMESIWSVATLALEAKVPNNNEVGLAGAVSTNDFITVNLYDYGNGINQYYNRTEGTLKKRYYPGFQQDHGTHKDGVKLDKDTGYNFGDNIVADRNANGLSLVNNTSVNGPMNTLAKRDNNGKFADAPANHHTANFLTWDPSGDPPMFPANMRYAPMYPKLVGGDPALRIDGKTSNTTLSLGYLFPQDPAAKDGDPVKWINGKYGDGESVDGLFKRDSASGAYIFNSRENHAQYDPDTNEFVLYDAIITANFMMYPFGNFLPFNDIIHECTKVGSIVADTGGDPSKMTGTAYFKRMEDSARWKAEHETTGVLTSDVYIDLADALKNFSAAMSNTHDGGWGAAEGINGYFTAAGVPIDLTQNNPADPDRLDKMYSIDYDESTDFFFGMDISLNFKQPEGGQILGLDGNYYDTVFDFTGDDDVWVFVDDLLFLDLSGIHRHVSGTINFTDGVVTYSDLDRPSGEAIKGSVTETFSEIIDRINRDTSGPRLDKDQILQKDGDSYTTFLEDGKAHTFKFYYMERGAGSGVCRMNINLDLVHAFSVEKEMTVDENGTGKGELLGNPDFYFQAINKSAQGKTEITTDDLFIKPGTSYVVYNKVARVDEDGKQIIEDGKPVYDYVKDEELDEDGKVKERKTDQYGRFTIKKGQKASFTDIKNGTGEYFIREWLNKDIFEQYGAHLSIDGSTESVNKNKDDIIFGEETFKGIDSPVRDTKGDVNTTFTFDNQVVFDKIGSLEISKKLGGEQTADTPDRSFEFEVRLDGELLPEDTPYDILDINGNKTGEGTVAENKPGIIVLKAGQTARIKNILAGSKFTVEEVANSAKGYQVTYEVDDILQTGSKAEGTIKAADKVPGGGVVAVDVTNTERKTSVDIPVTKTLQNTDKREHTYTFSVQPVGADGGPLPNTSEETFDVTIPAGTETGTVTNDKAHTIVYREADIDPDGNLQYPAKYYYQISEKKDPALSGTIRYDENAYIVEVTVEKKSQTADGGTGSDGNTGTEAESQKYDIEAKVTGYKLVTDPRFTAPQDGYTLSFTNELLSHELPETGGPGTFWYTFSGVAMMAIALMYDTFRRRKRRPVRS